MMAAAGRRRSRQRPQPVGRAGQRTNAYDSGRDIQRGPFVQFKWRRVTVGGYWFNPGSDDQIVVSMIGMTF